MSSLAHNILGNNGGGKHYCVLYFFFIPEYRPVNLWPGIIILLLNCH